MIHAVINPLDNYAVCGNSSEQAAYVVGQEQDESEDDFTEILGEIVMRLSCKKCADSLKIIYNHILL